MPNGKMKQNKGESDEFESLLGDGKARVEMTVAFAHPEYNRIKVGAVVTLTCDQSEAAINKAGEAAFRKAYEFAMDGYNTVCDDLKPA